jgi:hypothetical protein
MFLGATWLRNISDISSYIPLCHVVEEHILSLSALMTKSAYVPQDTLLGYVSRS